MSAVRIFDTDPPSFSVLASGGFEAYVINENAPVYVPLVQSVLVQVESSQAEAAKKFLEENLSAEPVDDNEIALA